MEEYKMKLVCITVEKDSDLTLDKEYIVFLMDVIPAHFLVYDDSGEWISYPAHYFKPAWFPQGKTVGVPT
jgi:hypothetical protein